MTIIGVRKDDVVFIFKNFYVRWLLWFIQNRRHDASSRWGIFRNWHGTRCSLARKEWPVDDLVIYATINNKERLK